MVAAVLYIMSYFLSVFEDVVTTIGFGSSPSLIPRKSDESAPCGNANNPSLTELYVQVNSIS